MNLSDLAQNNRALEWVRRLLRYEHRQRPQLGSWRLPPFPVAALWIAIGVPNLWFAVRSLLQIARNGFAETDWNIMRDGASHFSAGLDPYAGTLFRWSPAILFVIVPLVTLPFVVWVAAHVTAAMAMPGWPLKLLVLFSWPFVEDLTSGNVVVFSLLLAAWAIRGNRFSTGAYLLLTLLIPRPLAIPVLAWLLWRRPWVRIPFLVMLVAHGTVVLALDPHLHWIGQLLTSLGDVHNWFNFGPSAWIGSLWIPIGAALAVIFTKRGHLGMASLAAS
ncbi:MAG: hypothetical protein E6J50_09435, partial [Chloroflexi bacterium]